jgi:DNA-binding CsgD family transcriptional regulator
MTARAAYAGAVASRNIEKASEAAELFEASGAFLYAAEAASLEQSLAQDRGLARRGHAAGLRSALLLDRCEGATIRNKAQVSTSSSDGLTAREREVALLAVDGLTSRKIAERLFVSARTVDNHLQNVYMKLGISGRAELASRLQPEE